MSAPLSLLTGGNGIIAGLVAALIGAVALFLKGRSMGANAERDKQAARDAAAMNEAQKIDEAVAGNAPADNREALKRWGKKP